MGALVKAESRTHKANTDACSRLRILMRREDGEQGHMTEDNWGLRRSAGRDWAEQEALVNAGQLTTN